MFPIVDLQQKRAWAPMRREMILGVPIPDLVPWTVVWIQTIIGWVGSLVLAAVLSRNLIKRDQS